MVRSHSRTLSLITGSCAVVAILAVARGQGAGQWLAPFNHQHATATATDAEFPFTSPARPTWPPGSGAQPAFNAIHMALIPVGVHRGKVVVWDGGLTIGYADPFV